MQSVQFTDDTNFHPSVRPGELQCAVSETIKSVNRTEQTSR